MHRFALAAVLVIAAALFVYRYHAVIVQVLILVTVVSVSAWLLTATVQVVRLPAGSRHHALAARWHAFRWRWVARNLGLSYIDQHRKGIAVPGSTSVQVASGHELTSGRVCVRFPRARFRPDPYGFRVTVRCVPRIGREEVETASPYLCDAWRCARVSVTQSRPGRLELRGLRRDPLTRPLSAAAALPPVFDGRHVTLGRDEWGELRRVSLANHSGSVWAGNPGRGKTECAWSFAAQLATSPLVDTFVLDGGECDWQHFADGAAGYVGADLAAAADMLADLDTKMVARRRNLEADLGVRNAWKVGPSEAYPLIWVLVEEAPFFLSIDQVKGDRKRESQVATCRGFLASLLRRGRSPLFHTSLITQRATTANLPSDIRDLCGVRWSFGCANTDSAVAILGEDIRHHETLSPVQLQGDEHVGVASALLPTGTVPYTFLKFPAVGETLADKVAAQLASRRAQTPSVARVPGGIPALAACAGVAATAAMGSPGATVQPLPAALVSRS